MIDFYSENNFVLEQKEQLIDWLQGLIKEEQKEEGDLEFIFCSDDYLLGINVEFLQHDTLTDIITFDNSLGSQLHGEIYISTDRVQDNAKQFKVPFKEELARVLAHGVLHLCGYKDKSEKDVEKMREREEYYISKIYPHK